MPKKVLEEILKSVGEKDAKDFEGVLKYVHPDNQLKMRTEEYAGIKGGTEALMDSIYTSTKKFAQDEGLIGKTDKKTQASILEKFVLDALDKLPEGAQEFAKIFKARLKAGEYETADERIGKVSKFAEDYLGVDTKELAKAIKSGDPEKFYEQLRGLSLQASQGIVIASGNRKLQQTIAGREHKFYAYSIKHLRDNYKLEPTKLGKALEEGTGYQSILALQSQKRKEKYSLKGLDLTDYKPPEKK